MIPDTLLAHRAMRHLRCLVETIGPRPAGSQAERQAHAYAAEELARWRYRVETLPVSFAPLPRFAWLPSLEVLALVASGWGIRRAPWLVIVLPLFLATLPGLERWLLRRLPHSSQSLNTVAFTEARHAQAPLLVLCAHLDSAPASRFRSRFWLQLSHRSLEVVRRVAYAQAILAALRISGVPLPAWVYLAAIGAGCLAGGWLALFHLWPPKRGASQYTPGANDNASGASVLLALAEHYAAHPPRNLQLGFLFTGAEETGLHGAQAFAGQIDPSVAALRFLCLEQVGAGHTLRIITQSGALFPLRTDTKLNELLKAANPESREMWHTLRPGDYAAFIAAGFPATALQASGAPQAEIAHHTIYDTLEIIEPTTLDMTAQTVLRMVHLADHGKLFSQS